MTTIGRSVVFAQHALDLADLVIYTANIHLHPGIKLLQSGEFAVGGERRPQRRHDVIDAALGDEPFHDAVSQKEKEGLEREGRGAVRESRKNRASSLDLARQGSVQKRAADENVNGNVGG